MKKNNNTTYIIIVVIIIAILFAWSKGGFKSITINQYSVTSPNQSATNNIPSTNIPSSQPSNFPSFSITINCTDTDQVSQIGTQAQIDKSGDNPWVRGTCTDSIATYTDFCFTTERLTEYYCLNNECTRSTQTSTNNCASEPDMACINGACV